MAARRRNSTGWLPGGAVETRRAVVGGPVAIADSLCAGNCENPLFGGLRTECAGYPNSVWTDGVVCNRRFFTRDKRTLCHEPRAAGLHAGGRGSSVQHWSGNRSRAADRNPRCRLGDRAFICPARIEFRSGGAAIHSLAFSRIIYGKSDRGERPCDGSHILDSSGFRRVTRRRVCGVERCVFGRPGDSETTRREGFHGACNDKPSPRKVGDVFRTTKPWHSSEVAHPGKDNAIGRDISSADKNAGTERC